MRIGLIEKMRKIDMEIEKKAYLAPGAYLIFPNQPEPIKDRLQNKNWSSTEARDLEIFLYFLIPSVTKHEKKQVSRKKINIFQ